MVEDGPLSRGQLQGAGPQRSQLLGLTTYPYAQGVRNNSQILVTKLDEMKVLHYRPCPQPDKNLLTVLIKRDVYARANAFILNYFEHACDLHDCFSC